MRNRYYENRVRYFNQIFTSVLCATLVLVELSKVVNGSVLRNSDLQFQNEYYPKYHHRISRSPGVYIADENGQRVIIIISKKPVSRKNQSQFTTNYPNQYQTNTNLDKSLQHFPGALALIDILSKLGIPGLQSPTYTQDLNSANKESNTGFSETSTIKSQTFKADTNDEITIKKTCLIDILRNIGVPGLPKTTPKTGVGIRFRGGGIGGAGNLGSGKGAVKSGEFGADLDGGLLGGGFSRKKPSADSTNG